MASYRIVGNTSKILPAFYNNHNWGNAPANALQFKEMIGESLSKEQKDKKEEFFVRLRDR